MRLRVASSRSTSANLRAIGGALIELDELEPLARERGILIAANHPCLLDALMLLSCLPDGVPLMKADLERSAFWGAPAHLAGYISNRNILEAVRVARDRLAEGAQVLVFPEGTRTNPWPLGALRGALAIIAQRAQAPVQTVIIETDTLFLSKGWPLLRVPRLPLHFRVRLGRRFEPPQDDARFMTELRAHFEARTGARRAAAAFRWTAGQTVMIPSPTPSRTDSQLQQRRSSCCAPCATRWRNGRRYGW